MHTAPCPEEREGGILYWRVLEKTPERVEHRCHRTRLTLNPSTVQTLILLTHYI